MRRRRSRGSPWSWTPRAEEIEEEVGVVEGREQRVRRVAVVSTLTTTMSAAKMEKSSILSAKARASRSARRNHFESFDMPDAVASEAATPRRRRCEVPNASRRVSPRERHSFL